MTDPNAPGLTPVQRLKIVVVNVFSTSSTVAVLMGLIMTFWTLPAPACIALWAAGSIATHFWLFAGVARPPGERPSWHDLRSYTRDSGIPMIVFGWPISAAMMIVPEYVQYRLEKLLGIKWHAGVRIFA